MNRNHTENVADGEIGKLNYSEAHKKGFQFCINVLHVASIIKKCISEIFEGFSIFFNLGPIPDL